MNQRNKSAKIIALIALCTIKASSLSIAQEQTNERLQVESNRRLTNSKIEFEGTVVEQRKYSIVAATSGGKKYDVKITKDTNVVLRCASPRIDFQKKQLRIAVENKAGENKLYMDYSFESPVYLSAKFDHQNQFKRTMNNSPKRLNRFTVFADKNSLPAKNNEIVLTGEILAGESDRELKLKTESATYDVLLGKHGSWNGFSPLELQPNSTSVRVLGRADSQDVIQAKTIVFWPIAKTETKTDSDETEKSPEHK